MADAEKQTHSTRDFANGVETAGTYDPASYSKAGDVSLERINTYERVSGPRSLKRDYSDANSKLDWRPPAIPDQL